MKQNIKLLVETILYGTVLFIPIWVLLLYLAGNQTRTKSEKKTQRRRQKSHKYSAISKQAADYRQNIEKLIAANKSRQFSARLENILFACVEWESHIVGLVDRLLAFEDNHILHQDRLSLPKKIQRLRHRISREKDPYLLKEMQETLDSHVRHLNRLQNLSALMKKTELDLEEVVSDMGAIYSQLQILEAVDVRSRRARRLAHEIDEERSELDDLLSAIDEVYGDAVY
ncbi:MAG: hypothetical protein GY943_29695 [Chloroflexi bacterium]|nr:hypothetical protein [Chloroflexota bacterium]